MTIEQIRKKVYDTIRYTFSIYLLSDNTIIATDIIPDNWDKTMFVINLESIFDISISDDEEDKLTHMTVKDIVDYIQKRLEN